MLKEGYCEVWCMSGSTRVLIHLYDDGKVVATTSSGNVWVFDRLARKFHHGSKKVAKSFN